MIPAPPGRPLDAPGDIIEGVLVSAEQINGLYGNRLLIRLRTDDGTTTDHYASSRLWKALYTAAKDMHQPRLRITRLPDGPTVGNQNPAKNWQVDVIAPQSIPQPVEQSQPSKPSKRKGPAW